MQRTYTSLLSCLLLVILSNCSGPEPSIKVTDETTNEIAHPTGGTLPQEIRNIAILGDPYKVISVQTITTNNCDGYSPKTTVTRSLTAEQVTSFEVQVGAGSIVKGAPIPQILEAQLVAEIRAAIGRDIVQAYQQEISFDLVTDAGTANEHTISWREVKVNGPIEVVFLDGVAELLFQRIIGIELFDRSSMPISCENGPNTQVAPTETSPSSPTSEPVVVEVTHPQQFFSEENIPDGSSMTITVNDGELHAMTSGTICVADVCLPGGTDRGSVVIFLPAATYEVTGLNPGWNWHGAYHATPDQWEIIAEQLSGEQKIPGTCSDGDGCSIVDVVVVSPDGIVAQYQD